MNISARKILLGLVICASLMGASASSMANTNMHLTHRDDGILIQYDRPVSIKQSATDIKLAMKMVKAQSIATTDEFALLAGSAEDGSSFIVLLYRSGETMISKVVVIQLPSPRPEETKI